MGSRQERELNRQVRWSIIEITSDLTALGITPEAYDIYVQALTCDLPTSERIKVTHEATKIKVLWFQRGGHD